MAKILYVDDNAGVGKLVRRALIAAGHKVFTVETIVEALEELSCEKLDLAIWDGDIHREGDGADFAQQWAPRMKTMIYSANLKNRREGVHFCHKTGEIAVLITAVAEALKE